MALLSLIVPVYRVERYLTECLDSLLTQSFTDIEVIAVNDGSDDGSSAILASYTARDRRLWVIDHGRNLGLSAARNTGLRHATGQYVWCVDSDDWLPDGTLAAVADHLARTSPDILVTGYARVHPDGRTWHQPLADVTGVAVGRTDEFTLRERPGLIRALHIACNKVVRRGFLDRIGIGFGPGWYEDVSFSIPLLLAAERISLLDEVCYAYRQRPAGTITQTVSERHFDVFAHWRRVFEFQACVPGVAEDLRPLIFQRMIWHYLAVLGHDRRVPADRRREFFLRMAEHYHRYLPAEGYPMPAGVEGLKHRLVARRAYHTFESLRAVHRARGGLRTLIRGGRPLRTPVAR